MTAMSITAFVVIAAIVIVVLFALWKGYGVAGSISLNFQPKSRQPKS
jgi:hypothetical protein